MQIIYHLSWMASAWEQTLSEVASMTVPVLQLGVLIAVYLLLMKMLERALIKMSVKMSVREFSRSTQYSGLSEMNIEAFRKTHKPSINVSG
ncbi:MAG: hypothetical protein WDZ61_00950 [Parcubacteria group bacterium]